MKKTALALVIASAMPLSALADVTVYGKANVSLQNADEADESKLELVSNASRIGLKGSEAINDDWKAIYQFEYQTEVDDGANSGGQTFGQRNIYVGLQGVGGTIIGGNFDTPVKTAQEKIDLFNDLEGDINFITLGETRSKNIVQYTTPAAWGAFAANVALVAAEDEDLDDGASVSFTYTTPALYAAFAYEQDVTLQNVDIARLVGRYTIGQIQLGALYEQASYDEGDNEGDADGWILSAKFSATDALAFKLQYGDNAVEEEESGVVVEELDAEALSFGVDYLLSKNTTVFAYYTQEAAEEASTEVLDDNWFGVGMEYKF
jgi:predicted porin